MIRIAAFFSKILSLFLSLVFALGLQPADLLNPTPQEPHLEKRMTVTAHTGCLGQPENSVAAMEAGVATGADIVEFDLHFRADGTPVLSHYDPGENDCETLETAFAFLAKHPRIKANVDVKSTAFLEKVQSMAEAAGVLEQIFFTGLEEHMIPAAKEKCPDIPYYLNVNVAEDEDFDALAEKTAALGALGVNLYHKSASPELVRIMHERGLLVSLWTIGDADEAVRAVRLGADNITTYRPLLVRAIAGALPARVC